VSRARDLNLAPVPDVGVVLVFWRDGDVRCEWEPEEGRMRLVDGAATVCDERASSSREAASKARALFDSFHAPTEHRPAGDSHRHS
jgi:hypothetical protein